VTRELFKRYLENPILSAQDWPYPINAVFNPAATRVGSETVILARVETLNGVSHLGVARSPNGLSDWVVEPTPLLAPEPGVESEQWGFEDPRVTWVPERERFAITCTAYGPYGPAVYLAWTEDFHTVERQGMIMPADDKNACLLPERVQGNWLLFHRPQLRVGPEAGRGGISCSRSTDLSNWSEPQEVMHPRSGSYWDSLRIGLGPPPLKTSEGWLFCYHGVKETVAGPIYRIGLALTALADPTQLLRRADDWVFGPDADYERVGDIPNVVFPCGLTHDPDTDEVRLYYGAADTVVAVASAELSELLAFVLRT
jgi:predicted GH43/DUF377 family glycosyl hydrolase